jgi:muramoyltetrapeptide carboxypeptidase
MKLAITTEIINTNTIVITINLLPRVVVEVSNSVYKTPRKLKSGDSVAIVAPASPYLTDEVKVGLEVLKSYGLKPVLGPCVKNLRANMDHAASVEQRALELNWALTDPSIGAVWCVQGGIGCGAVLPFLDYEEIEAAAKPFVGMSDITAISCGLLSHAGLINYCGQGVAIRIDKGPEVKTSDSISLAHTVELLMSDQEWDDRPFDINQYMPRTVSPGKAQGVVVGGNLETFVTMIGTPFMPEVAGAILFLEDVHKNGESVERQLLHLEMSGVLDEVAGIVVGEFAEQDQQTGLRVPHIEDVIREYLSNGAPCSYGNSFSHGNFTIPIPIGAMCELDADTGVVRFRHKLSD